jgi:hypothetical protein
MSVYYLIACRPIALPTDVLGGKQLVLQLLLALPEAINGLALLSD